jgi:hypothetical protein
VLLFHDQNFSFVGWLVGWLAGWLVASVDCLDSKL